MAKQINPLVRLKGTISGISFYKSQEDGYLAREKTGIDPERMKTDPAFRLTRLNAAEFGAAGKAGKVFRTAFLEEISIASDKRLVSRVTRLMMKVLQTDTTHSFGQRTVDSGNHSLLDGLQFNGNVSFNTIIKPELTAAFDRETGQVAISWPSFIPEKSIVAPSGTTHFRIFVVAAAIDFVNGNSSVSRQSTTGLPLDKNPGEAISLQTALTPNNTLPVFLVAGIEFLKIINNEVFTQSKAQNAMQLVKVSLPG